MSNYNFESKKIKLALIIAEKTVEFHMKLTKINEEEQKKIFIDTFNTIVNDRSID